MLRNAKRIAHERLRNLVAAARWRGNVNGLRPPTLGVACNVTRGEATQKKVLQRSTEAARETRKCIEFPRMASFVGRNNQCPHAHHVVVLDSSSSLVQAQASIVKSRFPERAETSCEG